MGGTITDKYLVKAGPHKSGIGGEQRIYRFDGDMGLSLVNSAMLHHYPFAWEAAVLDGVKEDGTFGHLRYDTGLTEDVEVFETEDEANAFIERAAAHFAKADASS